MKRVIYICLLCLLSAITVSAQTVKDLQQQRKRALQQLENTDKMLKQTKKNETATTNKLNIINRDINQRRKLISTINSEITALDKQMRELTRQTDSLEKELERTKQAYSRLVVQNYHAHSNQSMLLFLLSADNFNQMVRRMQYMAEASAYHKQQVEKIKQLQDDIDHRNQELADSRQQKKEALQTQNREKDRLSSDMRKQEKLLSSLKKQEKKLKTQQQQQQKKANELQKQIEKMIAEQQKKTGKKALTKDQQLLAGGFEKNKGRLPWPTDNGFISGQFGLQPDPVLKSVTRNNKGIYIQTTAGSTARAVYDGEVTSCFSDGQTNAVIVRHGNYYTVYANLSKLNVKTGQKVKAKQTIGTIFTDPDEDNKTELFFQVWKNRDIENPSLWITK